MPLPAVPEKIITGFDPILLASSKPLIKRDREAGGSADDNNSPRTGNPPPVSTTT